MVRKISFLLAALLLAALVIAPVPALANPGQPSFSERVYGDGVAWGTKGTTSLPAPNAHNVQSFDKLFVITNGVDGQLPVAEAAPGNVNYNGGRWFTHTVTWKIESCPTDLVCPDHGLLGVGATRDCRRRSWRPWQSSGFLSVPPAARKVGPAPDSTQRHREVRSHSGSGFSASRADPQSLSGYSSQ